MQGRHSPIESRIRTSAGILRRFPIGTSLAGRGNISAAVAGNKEKRPPAPSVLFFLSTGNHVQNLEEETGKHRHTIDDLSAAMETAEVGIDDIAPRIKELRTQIGQYRDQQLSSSLNARQTIKPLTTNQLNAYVADLRALLVEGSIFERKSFIKSFVREIIVKDKQVTVIYMYPMIEKVGQWGIPKFCALDKKLPRLFRTQNF
jgi:hypothetical protein